MARRAESAKLTETPVSGLGQAVRARRDFQHAGHARGGVHRGAAHVARVGLAGDAVPGDEVRAVAGLRRAARARVRVDEAAQQVAPRPAPG